MAIFGLEWQNIPSNSPNPNLAILVTGASTGLGREMAFSLAKKGFLI